MGSKRSIDELLSLNGGLVAKWEALDEGHSEAKFRHAVKGMREVHDGVYLSGHAPLTDWQRWKAATITDPRTVLSEWSGAAFWGFNDRDRWPTTVKRFGSGGPVILGPRPERLGSLRVARTTYRLAEDTVRPDGLPVFTVPRLAVELSAQMGHKRRARMVRDILRLKLATGIELRAQLALQVGWRGTKELREFVDLYARLPAERTRSDAEILAVGLLEAAGFAVPVVNVLIGGAEADLVDFDRRLVIELDGPQYHLFAEEDARKQEIWEDHGFVVRRVPTDDVYLAPEKLFAAANDPFTVDELARAGRTPGVNVDRPAGVNVEVPSL